MQDVLAMSTAYIIVYNVYVCVHDLQNMCMNVISAHRASLLMTITAQNVLTSTAV